MKATRDHAAVVSAWAARDLEGKPSPQMVQAFEEAFAALWRRAGVALGEVTLIAIVDRVFRDSVASFPLLESLAVGGGAVDFAPLRERALGLEPERLREPLVFVLVRFLTVLGNLTAEILTGALHSELSRQGKKP
jgi:hypothetical protein